MQASVTGKRLAVEQYFGTNILVTLGVIWVMKQ